MIILTIDLEDWFHILDNKQTASPSSWDNFESRIESMTLELLDLFDKYSVTATVFVLGWVASKYPALVCEVKKRGHEIACHSHFHQLVYTQSCLEFEADLVQATEAIQTATGEKPIAYRAPGFSITKDSLWAFNILLKHGYEVDCSVFPLSRAHGGIPGFPEKGPCELIGVGGLSLICLPINVAKLGHFSFVYSGGGYFRMVPEFLLRSLFRKDPYIMTYFHPRDFDPDQPMVPGLSVARKLKSYVGLSKSKKKLETLLQQFQFITVSEAVNEVRRSKKILPRVKLDFGL